MRPMKSTNESNCHRRIAKLEAQLARSEQEVHIAAGMLSTYGEFASQNPHVALEAIREAADEMDAIDTPQEDE